MKNCYIALGSNLNDPQQQIQQALFSLDTLPNSRRIKTSGIYRTKPVGPEQPDFCNAVTKLQTTLDPFTLLQELKRIEQQQGRIPSYYWGPRIIDLDILLYEKENIHLPELTIPHPHMLERLFVLIPLQEIEPTICLEGKHIQYFIDCLPKRHRQLRRTIMRLG